MRILHAISGIDPENGGPTFALLGLAEAQVRAGMDVTVLATWQIQSGFPLADRMRQRGVKVQHIGPARGKLSTYPGLSNIVSQAAQEADVVHIHALWEQMQHEAARAAMKLNKPYVITPHGMLAPWSLAQGSIVNRWGKALYLLTRLRKNLDRAAAVHFTTTMERDLVAPMRLRPPVIVEPVGIEVEEFEPLPQRGAFRARQTLLGQRPVMLFLSRLSPQKGLDRLIPAFAAFCRRQPSDAVLVLAGPDYDGYSKVVEELIERSGVKDRIIRTGMLRGRERVEALVDADLFVLPSHHENFGIVVAEAMAAGRAVVVSREVNLCSDVIESGAGDVIRNDEQLVDAMIAAMGDADRRRAAGERGRAYALSHYSWDLIAGHWKSHYARLLQS